MRTTLTLLITLGLASPLSAQEQLGGRGGTQREAYGWMVETVGDLNGDGVDDVMIGAPEHTPSNLILRTGRVEVLSGATLTNTSPTVLYDITGPIGGCVGTSNESNFGASGAGGRDVTGDGVPDFVVSAWVAGYVTVFDGATGTDVLDGTGFDLNGPCLRQHGYRLALADIDGDAHADLLATRVDLAVVGRGRVRVYDGASIANPGTAGPQLLYARPSPVTNDSFGAALAVLGDIDGDGRDDFAVGAPRNSTAWPGGSVAAFSGATGTLLHRFGAVGTASSFGVDLAAMGDVDDDGIADLAISGVPDSTAIPSGNIEVVSGAWMASGGVAGPRTILTATPEPTSSHINFGLVIDAVDVNGDGRRDVVAAREDRSAPGGPVMGWDVVSGRTGEIMWGFDAHVGSSLTRRPDAAAVAAGSKLRLVLGSSTDATIDASQPVGFGYAYVVDAHDGRGTARTFGIGCPCGNDDPGAGCANATGSGALLAVEAGTVSLSGASLEATTTGLPPNTFGFLLGGLPRSPVSVGNGLLGATNIIRMPPVPVQASGTAVITDDLLGDFAARAPQFGAAAPTVGVPFAMQFAYRDTDCAGVQTSAFNVSNTYVVVPRP